MDYNKINSRSACFIELNKILERLQFSNYSLDEYEKKFNISNDKQLSSKEKPMVRILWECIVLNLKKFLEIHDHILGKILKDLGYITLQQSLEECVKTIKEIDEEIYDYRKLIAHSKEQASNYFSYVDLDSDFYRNSLKIKLASRIAVIYICCIFVNLPDVVNQAMLELKIRTKHDKKQRPEHVELNISKEIKKITKTINLKLEKNGFDKFSESLKRDYDS